MGGYSGGHLFRNDRGWACGEGDDWEGQKVGCKVNE